jgi:hypothetical protein
MSTISEDAHARFWSAFSACGWRKLEAAHRSGQTVTLRLGKQDSQDRQTRYSAIVRFEEPSLQLRRVAVMCKFGAITWQVWTDGRGEPLGYVRNGERINWPAPTHVSAQLRLLFAKARVLRRCFLEETDAF